LQLGNGGATGSIVGDILNNGTLAINRTGTLALNGTISGFAFLAALFDQPMSKGQYEIFSRVPRVTASATATADALPLSRAGV
jgi:hypothetical protein